jgi:hypothetical protein
MTVRDIRKHLAEIYDVDVAPDLISRVTQAVWDELEEWRNRPPTPVYPIVYIDPLNIKIRDGIVSNRPAYLAVGIDLEGRKQMLGIWIGDTEGEGSKFWLQVLTEFRNRGVAQGWNAADFAFAASSRSLIPCARNERPQRVIPMVTGPGSRQVARWADEDGDHSSTRGRVLHAQVWGETEARMKPPSPRDRLPETFAVISFVVGDLA